MPFVSRKGSRFTLNTLSFTAFRFGVALGVIRLFQRIGVLYRAPQTSPLVGHSDRLFPALPEALDRFGGQYFFAVPPHRVSLPGAVRDPG